MDKHKHGYKLLYRPEKLIYKWSIIQNNEKITEAETKEEIQNILKELCDNSNNNYYCPCCGSKL